MFIHLCVRNLGKLREMLPGVPILALTATATPIVRKDICNSLNLMWEIIILGNFFFDVSIKSYFQKSKICVHRIW